MTTKSETLYRKVGRRYYPVAEQMLREAHVLGHGGSWLVRSGPGSVEWRTVKPNHAKTREILESSIREELVKEAMQEWDLRMNSPCSEYGGVRTFSSPYDVATKVIERLCEYLDAKSSANNQ